MLIINVSDIRICELHLLILCYSKKYMSYKINMFKLSEHVSIYRSQRAMFSAEAESIFVSIIFVAPYLTATVVMS